MVFLFVKFRLCWGDFCSVKYQHFITHHHCHHNYHDQCLHFNLPFISFIWLFVKKVLIIIIYIFFHIIRINLTRLSNQSSSSSSSWLSLSWISETLQSSVAFVLHCFSTLWSICSLCRSFGGFSLVALDVGRCGWELLQIAKGGRAGKRQMGIREHLLHPPSSKRI